MDDSSLLARHFRLVEAGELLSLGDGSSSLARQLSDFRLVGIEELLSDVASSSHLVRHLSQFRLLEVRELRRVASE